VVSARGATSQGKRCLRSAHGVPPVSATPTRSQRTGRHSSARRVPLFRSRGATCQRRPDRRPVQGPPLSSKRGATFQWKGCHQSEQAPPLFSANPATLAIVVSDCSRTTCRVNVRALLWKVDPLSHESGSPCAEVVLPLARSGAGSPRVSRPPICGAGGVCHLAAPPRGSRVTPRTIRGAPLAFGRSVLDYNQAIPAARSRDGVARRASPRLALRVTPPSRAVIPACADRSGLARHGGDVKRPR
jgi:hypothetical protein